MEPIMIGFSFPILFMISGVTLANTKNIIMKGNWTFAASTESPPNPSGIGLLTSCTTAGYIMNIVTPVAISKIYDGRRILCLSNLKSRNGGTIFRSMITKTDNEIADAMNAATICGRFAELTPICMSVSAMRNEVIVAESARTPLMSIEKDTRFLLKVISGTLAGLDWSCSLLFSFTNFAIISVTKAENGTMAKKVACHPKFWMMLAPAKRPTTEPAEYADPNTPIAIASFAGGNVSLRRLKAAGTAANPTP